LPIRVSSPLTFFAGTNFAQKFKRIDAEIVTVAPSDFHPVSSNRLNLLRNHVCAHLFSWGFVFFAKDPWLALTHRAGAGPSQLEGIVAGTVPIGPEEENGLSALKL